MSASSPPTTPPSEPAALAQELIGNLAGEIGPRRPGSTGERAAAACVERVLAAHGLDPWIEAFRGPNSFAWAQAVPLALGLLRPGFGALLLGLAESTPQLEPVSRASSLMASRNVLARIEPDGECRRTLVLVSHLDTSRSGLLFHPRLAPHLRKLLGLVSAAMLGQAVGRHLRGSALGGRLASVSRLVLAGGLCLLAERELRGHDVPGANDNASGVAVATGLACELARSPLAHTRVVFLATGCEESGTAGMRAFLERHRGQWEDWLFLNLDGVGAPATLRYLPREGINHLYRADPGLVRTCERLARRRPDLGLQRAERLAGLTYDSTPVLARGGRALTLSAQDATIPNYHTATDVLENIDEDVLRRALETARELAFAIDRGEPD